MQIPNFLESKLKANHSLVSFTTTALDRISRYVQANRLVFFPEYTDHGIKHIELTLQTSIDLATTEAQQLITPQDSAVLITAVGLHDFGMHLSRDGFESLITPGCIWRPITDLDSKPWNELWDDFFAEAIRYDGRKLYNLFGEKYQPVKPLPEKGEAWDEFDILLVGEFLRRHHPRLAHEIAVYGFPGKDGNAKAICHKETQEDEFLANMAGFVARSHGMNLRDCISYLEKQYRNKVDPRRVHAVYLMALLRLADYFQIQASRAPTERTEVESFHSGFSDGEWKLHQCITDINYTGDDPEALTVDAKPVNVATFLKLKDWLIGVQNELDISWAVLGEVFGRQTHNELNTLGVKIRRVKSNLDDINAFAENIDYIPEKLIFEAANSDLLKLLVGPLYDNDASIGIRELIQNSVDAVLELNDLVARRIELQGLEFYDQESDVLINFDCDKHGIPKEITITDRGIGMTPNTIKNYFLKAGASFRKSDAWKRTYEDDDGHSRIFRTGRFGVGALAAFLLGDEIEITTRYIKSLETEGVTFKASVDSDAIEIKKSSCPIGTRIKIIIPERLKGSVGRLVPPEWYGEIDLHIGCGQYFLRSPSVKIKFSHLDNDLSYAWYLPQPESESTLPWRMFTDDNFHNIYWTYDMKFPKLSCNGIPILRSNLDKLNSPIEYLRSPQISLFDRDGRLPVNLPRTGLQAKKLPFEEGLYQSITDDIIAYALTSAPTKCEGTWLHGKHNSFLQTMHDVFRWRYRWTEYISDPQWLISKNGFILNDINLIKKFAPTHIIFVVGGDTGYYSWGDSFRKAINNQTLLMYFYPNELNKKIKGPFKESIYFQTPLSINFKDGKLYVPRCAMSKINHKPGKEIRSLLPMLVESSFSNEWFVADQIKASYDFSKIEATITNLDVKPDNPIMINVLTVDKIMNDTTSTLVSNRWMEVLGTPEIPFDVERRAELEKRASKTIESYIELNKEELKLRESEQNRSKKEN